MYQTLCRFLYLTLMSGTFYLGFLATKFFPAIRAGEIEALIGGGALLVFALLCLAAASVIFRGAFPLSIEIFIDKGGEGDRKSYQRGADFTGGANMFLYSRWPPRAGLMARGDMFEVRTPKTIQVKRGEKIIGVGGNLDIVCPQDLCIQILSGTNEGYTASVVDAPDSQAPWTGSAVSKEKALYRCVEAVIKGRKDKR